MAYMIFASLLYVAGVAEAYDCQSAIKTPIEIVSLTTDFAFHRADNLTDSVLEIIYEWDVVNSDSREPVTAGYDGFLYKVQARASMYELNSTFYNEINDYNDQACMNDELRGDLWLTESTGNSTNCSFPFTGRFPPICNDSEVCSLLEKKYKALKPSVRKLKLPIKFGKIYDFHILPYTKWNTGYGELTTGSEVIKFCKHELIHRHNVSLDNAHKFCGDDDVFTDKLSDHMIYSGPVSHFELFGINMDFENNVGNVTFRWKEPYDFYPNVTVTGYLITLDEGETIHQNWSYTDRYNTYTFQNVSVAKTRWVQVSPVLRHYPEPYDMVYIVRGAIVSQSFSIPEFDACSEDNGVGGRYCDPVANCTDYNAEAEVAATCVCPSHFCGNGIAKEWFGGDGCTQYSVTALIVSFIVVVVVIIAIILAAAFYKRKRRWNRKILLDEDQK